MKRTSLRGRALGVAALLLINLCIPATAAGEPTRTITALPDEGQTAGVYDIADDTRLLEIQSAGETVVTPTEVDFSCSGGTIQGLKPEYLSTLSAEQKQNIQLVIPAAIDGEDVTAIGNNAFYSGNGANAGCRFVELDLSQVENLTTIGTNAFRSSPLTGTLTLPETVKTIGQSAFDISSSGVGGGFTGELIFPDSVESIGPSAFKGQSGIMVCRLSKNIVGLKGQIFYGCSNLARIEIPADSKLATLEGNIFAGSKIKSIELPAGITFAGTGSSGPFYNCTGLTAIVCANVDDYTRAQATSISNKDKLTYPVTVSFDDGAEGSYTPLARLYNCPLNLVRGEDGVWSVDGGFRLPPLTAEEGTKRGWAFFATASLPAKEGDKVVGDTLYVIETLSDPTITFGPDVDKDYDGTPTVLMVEADHPLYRNGATAVGNVVFNYKWYWDTIGGSNPAYSGLGKNQYDIGGVRAPFAISCQVVVQACLVNIRPSDGKLVATPFYSTSHTFIVDLRQGTPVVTPSFGPTEAGVLPDIGVGEASTLGTIAWTEGQTLLAGTHDYGWSFTPEDETNYKTLTASNPLSAWSMACSAEHGTLTGGSDVVEHAGSGAAFTLTPDEGYRLGQLLLNEVDVTDEVHSGVYVFGGAAGAHTLSAVFASAVPAAKIGDTTYPTLAEAVAAAKAGDIVTLLTDTEPAGSIQTAGKEETLIVDLANHTISVPDDQMAHLRPFDVDPGRLTIKNGTLDGRGDGTVGKGAYGTVYVGQPSSEVTIENCTLINNRPNGLNVKAVGGVAWLRDTTIKANVGGGVEAAGGVVNMENCTVTQSGYYDWCSSAVTASTGGTLNVHGGTYTSEIGWGIYVFNSGATINIYDGTFTATDAARAVLKADKSVEATPSIINVYGGAFRGKLSIAEGAQLHIYGGEFAQTGLTKEAFERYVAPGHALTEKDGTYTVSIIAAEYTAVTAALSKIPADLSGYSAESVAALNAAVEAVVYDLNVNHQAEVDDFAAAIEAAVAGLQAKTLTITLDPAGGQVGTFTKTVQWGGVYGALPVPTRSGYTFVGWYTAQTGGTAVTEADTVTVTEDQTLFARWERRSGGDNDGGGTTTPVEPPKTETGTTTEGDVTVKTETTTTENKDGSTTTEKVETATNEATGEKTEIKATETVAKDGSLTKEEIKTTVAADGAKTEEKTVATVDAKTGTSATTTVKTDAAGKTAAAIVVENTKDAKAVTVSADAVKSAAAADEATMTVKTAGTQITLDASAIAAVAAAKGESVSIAVETVKTEALPEAAKEALKDATVVDLSITVGESKVSSFDGGKATVAVPYTKVDSTKAVAVYYVSDEGVLTRVPGARYDEKSGSVEFTTGHFSYYAVMEETPLSFSDVTEGDWHYDAVRYVTDAQLFAGTGATTFGPNATMTREMLATVLYRKAGSPAVSGMALGEFGDSDKVSAWAQDAMLWAVQEGILTGVGENQLDAQGAVTRQQLAVILYRAALSPEVGGMVLSEFSDGATVAEWAVNGMVWAVENGVITGRDGGVLAPTGTATRAEVATMLLRMA